jgi:hypothetical protein
MRRFIITAIVCLAALGACGKQEDGMDQKQVEAVAAEARSDIDALAAQLGTDPVKKQDVLSDCVPGDRDSGKLLMYTVRVTADDSAAGRLRGEISDDFAADGWTVKSEPSGPGVGETVAFQKGSATMSASVFADKGYAVVTGSGGCVK